MNDRTCTLDGCDAPHRARGFCHSHYVKARKAGTIAKIDRPHTVSGADMDAMVGDCSTCGPSVPLLRHANGSPTCRKRARDASRESYRNNVEERRAYFRRYNRAHKYAMKREALDGLLSIDDLACEICEKPLTLQKARIDHDHACCDGRKQTCGECFRGILCNSCNSALGLMGDDVERMARAIEYIQTRGVPTRRRRAA